MTNLTILLLRESITEPVGAIEGQPTVIPINDHDGRPLGVLFTEHVPEKEPAWVELFASFTDRARLGTVKSTSAVYIVGVRERFFALTFGHGRFLLKSDAVEERFGLLVVLNSVSPKKLRSIDKRTFDTVDQNSRVQVSQQSPAAEFGIDIEKDLVRAITGLPADDSLGSRLTGADSLSVSVKTRLDELPALLGEYLSRFASTEYRAAFEWIDHISEVKRKSVKAHELDARLVAILNEARADGSDPAGTWIAVPDLIDYRVAHRFTIRTRRNIGTRSDLSLLQFFTSLTDDETIDINLLHGKEAYAVDENGRPVGDKWSIYKCIHCELDVEARSYLLANGRWFQVKASFREEIDSFYNSIPRIIEPVLPYEHESESLYNTALYEADPSRFVLMDMRLVQVGGVHDKVEFCDLYSTSKELWHVKRYGGSGLLGHLFNQGLVSGELLREDHEFVSKVNALLPATHVLDGDSTVPRPVDDYTIVFAIISEQPGDELTIPFFARVALKHVYKRLSALGYSNIRLCKIPVTDRHKLANRRTTRGSRRSRRQTP